MNPRPEELKSKARDKRKENRKFFDQLKDESPKQVDEAFHEAHEEVFAQTDCLACGNCCKTTSPYFLQEDITRIAKHLKLKPAQFIDQYLCIDEDKDYVFKAHPCPFLLQDNRCAIYEVRPEACRQYPHTDRRKMHQILEVTYRNIEVCPAVFEIVERMKRSFD
jgi:Fe-S-cluster containining protein